MVSFFILQTMRKVSIPSFETAELLSNHGLCIEELLELLEQYHSKKCQPELPDRWKQFIFRSIELETPEVRAMLDFLNVKPL